MNCTKSGLSADCGKSEAKKIASTSTERQKRSQNLAPVLVIISVNSLVFPWKVITSTGFYRCCAPGASAPVVLKKISLPERAPKKCAKPHCSCSFLYKKCAFVHFRALCLELEAPLLVQIHVLAVWALWLHWKYTTQ